MIKKFLRKIYNKINKKKLLNKNFSIISNNCMGGFIYHDLGVKFNSPFINLWIKPKDYIKLLQNLDYYLGLDLVETFEDGIFYPIGLLGDVKIYFQHYDSFDMAFAKWNLRKKRINYDNLFIIFTARDGYTYEDLISFDQLKYDNKICFVNKPFETIKSTFYIKEFEHENEVGHLYRYISKLSIRKYYDYFDWVEWFNKN